MNETHGHRIIPRAGHDPAALVVETDGPHTTSVPSQGVQALPRHTVPYTGLHHIQAHKYTHTYKHARTYVNHTCDKGTR